MSKKFSSRHLGSGELEVAEMLRQVGHKSMEVLMNAVVPQDIRLPQQLQLPEALGEEEALARLQEIMQQDTPHKSYIGQGYYGTYTPRVIQRNILENPGWYTAYTPYQAEISQGRLEALLNFQTMIVSLTGLPVANSSLLDEGTAAAEAMAMALSQSRNGTCMFVSANCHPQTITVLHTRAEPLGIELIIGDWRDFDPSQHEGFFAALVQYPDSHGEIDEFADFFEKVHAAKGLALVAADLLALTLLPAPGEFGADICLGSSQRFGVPMGFGGPHAGYMSCADKLKRKLPGRIVGVSHDTKGRPGLRLALQTREQHIRRDKATSNICTAQVLLAVMASMYAVYHGPEGLREIAAEISQKANALAKILRENGFQLRNERVFDTLTITNCEAEKFVKEAQESARINLRYIDSETLGISIDETSKVEELIQICKVLGITIDQSQWESSYNSSASEVEKLATRKSEYLTETVFNSHHTETQMLRYIHRLEVKDLALNESMIPLGSCTMKLNSTAEMIPISWEKFSNPHPFCPPEQVVGYRKVLDELAAWLAEITGFAKVSLQPNAGSQGEYAGLLAIRRYHAAREDKEREICLIPMSAHGTNPASAVMAGMKVVAVSCEENGNIDIADLEEKLQQHGDKVAALMVTYPSTHGVFEPGIRRICELVHQAGGLVYMDGANMNAQVGFTSPAYIGADVCHLNLHKTFCIPHGGGGPGVGPIGVNEKLIDFLPGLEVEAKDSAAVSSAPWGSASIIPIPWMYIAMMGTDGLQQATEQAILNANYIASRLADYYPVLYTGETGLVAHECIIDVRPLTEQSGVTVEDVAKRLMDYGYHAPTMSWPVAGTLMIEPTESESKEELDRFCNAMISIYKEAMDIVEGRADATDNVLKNAPHPAEDLCTDDWSHPYSREQAAYPMAELRQHKFWPSVSRIDNVAGDRNLICTCDGMESYTDN